MADVLGKYAVARENSFFKVEQEADLQRHQRRLIAEGLMAVAAGGNLRVRRQQTFEESIDTFEVLPEVLQQQARIDVPDAANLQDIVRRVRALPPELTEAERRALSSSLYGAAAMIGHVPRMTFGRDRYNLAHEGGTPPPVRQVPLSPEAQEGARRAFVAAARAMAYGSVLGAAAVAVGGLAAARAAGVSSLDDLRASARAWAQPLAGAVSAALAPVKEGAQALLGPTGDAPAPDSEFLRRVVKRYNPGKLAASEGAANNRTSAGPD